MLCNMLHTMIARTDGARCWHQTRAFMKSSHRWALAAWVNRYRATDTLLHSSFGLPTKLHCSDEHRLEGENQCPTVARISLTQSSLSLP